MKIAFCFSGQIRTGVHNFPNIKKFIGDLWDNCDFFVHTWNIETYTVSNYASQFALENNIPPNTPYSIPNVRLSEFYNLYFPKIMLCEEYNNWFKNCKTLSDPNFYSIKRVNEMKINYEKNNFQNYDFVVSTRPDCNFDTTKSLKEDIAEILDNRTFCYGKDLNHDSPLNYVESTYWLGSSYVIDQVSQFEYIQGNKNHIIKTDGFLHMGNWIADGLCFKLIRLKNSKTAIYRWRHFEQKLSPLDNWEKFLP